VRLAYVTTIFLSAALLFLSQPILAKTILPWFGGSAGVWVTCMLFFQVALLLGYLYAYAAIRYLSSAMQTAVHVALLIASAFLIPAARLSEPNAGEHPVWEILSLLGTSMGLPYFMLSTTTPLFQAWLSESGEVRFPYRLFALSNLGSLLALLAYPFAIEVALSTRMQLLAWSDAYVVFVLLAMFVALRRSRARAPGTPSPVVLADRQAWLWIALAACSSTLWIAVANHLSQEVAAVPFVWVLPLSLYLLSFILCFDREGWYRPAIFRWILPAACIAMGLRLAVQGTIGGFQWEFLLFSAALLICCMFCHGELALRKPKPREGLTLFYLSIATGGALGAVFVGLLAPRLFSGYIELPIGIVACVLLGLALLYGYSSPRHLVRLALIAALAFVVSVRVRPSINSVLRVRNFYGTLQVVEAGAGDAAVRALYNGAILHGVQFLSKAKSALPTTYYGPESGIGSLLASHRTENRRVGVIGLGVGTLAAYGRPGDYFRFYEINPRVIEIASTRFDFLRSSQARVEVIAGDGRLALEREPESDFDVLVVDAFSGDSIPVHLLTRQAFELYFRHLRPGGTVAFHVTNKYLDLASVVRAQAAAIRKRVVWMHNAEDRGRAINEADWSLLSDGSPEPVDRRRRPWTDDYSNLFQILKIKFAKE
jgi:SAM-dependent methyltransferase